MNGKQAWLFVGFTVAVTAVLLVGTFAVQEATGIPAYAVLGTVLLVGLVLAVPRRTRLFGLACLLSVVLEFLFILVAAAQTGS